MTSFWRLLTQQGFFKFQLGPVPPLALPLEPPLSHTEIIDFKVTSGHPLKMYCHSVTVMLWILDFPPKQTHKCMFIYSTTPQRAKSRHKEARAGREACFSLYWCVCVVMILLSPGYLQHHGEEAGVWAARRPQHVLCRRTPPGSGRPGPLQGKWTHPGKNQIFILPWTFVWSTL